MKLVEVPGHRDLKRDSASGNIYVRMYREKKGELFKSTKTDNVRDARKVADLIIQDFLGLKPKGNSLELVEDLWPKWTATKDDKAKATLESIAFSWKRLQPFFGAILPNEITPMKWEEYILFRRKFDSSQKFFNDRKWLRMFVLWLHENGAIEKSPRFRNPDPTRSNVGKYITYDEFKRLLDNAHPDLQLQILMAYTMGMRISEVMCLTWGLDRENNSFIDLEGKIICLHKKDTKIRRSRTFAISEYVYSELVLRHRDASSDYVWPSLRDPTRHMDRQGNKSAWKSCRAKAKVKCRFHDLRHSFLTNAFKAGEGKIDSMLICEYAGLDITQAQETYLHFDAEDTRVVSGLVRI